MSGAGQPDEVDAMAHGSKGGLSLAAGASVDHGSTGGLSLAAGAEMSVRFDCPSLV